MFNNDVDFSLSGKAVLVTGATGYLGQAMTWALARSGAKVLINSRNAESSEVLVAEVISKGLMAEPAVFDIKNGSAVAHFFAEMGDTPLHGLVNNAYSGNSGTIESVDDKDYIDSYYITISCAHRLLKYSLPNLRMAVAQCGEASIVNISSMYGVVSPDLRVYDTPQESNPPFYGAAKAALIQWSRYAACEFGVEGIRVNSISPGPFPSKVVQKEDPKFVKRLADKVPMRRIGQAHEIGGAVVFLLSHASSFVNGANLTIDGGWTAW